MQRIHQSGKGFKNANSPRQVLVRGQGRLRKFTLSILILLLLLGCAIQAQAGVMGCPVYQISNTAGTWCWDAVFDIDMGAMELDYLLAIENPLPAFDGLVSAPRVARNPLLTAYASLVQSHIDKFNQDYFMLGVDAAPRPDASFGFSETPMAVPESQETSAVPITRKDVAIIILFGTPLLLLGGAALGFVPPKLGILLAILWILFWIPIEKVVYEIVSMLGDALG